MNFSTRMLFLILFFTLQAQAQKKEMEKMKYEIKTETVLSKGEYAPFWLVNNRHGLSSFENHSSNLSTALYRDFDDVKGFTWAYGVELAGTRNHSSPFYVQQLYADIKYNCWELGIGSKERASEGKHPTLSGGGLSFSPNARPMPQVRFGINRYTTIPWLFNEWVHIKGHFSYGMQTDGNFQKRHMNKAPIGSRYVDEVFFHEKTAFLKIGKPEKTPFSIEMGVEMYTQFGGTVWEKQTEGDMIRYELPHSYKEFFKAFIPLAGGSESTDMDQTNINGNVLGSLHLALNYQTANWSIRAYYEHYYEDHSGLFGLDYHYNREGEKSWVTYLPWRDGLFGLELTVPKNRIIDTFVYEFITSRDQSGPILRNPSGDMTGQAGGKDWYYTHTYYQSWQHWGMSMCNPHFLSPLYNKEANMTMPYSRIRSHHIGFNGTPSTQLEYRVMASWTKHWGSYEDPLPTPLTQLSTMAEIVYRPDRLQGWKFMGALAYDHSRLIGNNFGAMFSVCKTGWLSSNN